MWTFLVVVSQGSLHPTDLEMLSLIQLRKRITIYQILYSLCESALNNIQREFDRVEGNNFMSQKFCWERLVIAV